MARQISFPDLPDSYDATHYPAEVGYISPRFGEIDTKQFEEVVKAFGAINGK